MYPYKPVSYTFITKIVSYSSVRPIFITKILPYRPVITISIKKYNYYRKKMPYFVTQNLSFTFNNILFCKKEYISVYLIPYSVKNL